MAKKKTADSKQKQSLKDAIASINKEFGEGTILDMGAAPREYDVISTGSLALDDALGIGGLPLGRIAEIYGPESSGKTTLALHLIAAAQQRGLTCAFIDAEHALDIEYASNLGVQVDDLLVSQPSYGEQALRVCDTLVNSGSVQVIVVDSVAALTPKAELEGEIGDSHVGLQPRMMSQALRMLKGAVNLNHVLLVFINQVRMKIGVMFGSPETTPGGRALRFYASIRLDVRRIGSGKQGDVAVSNKTRVKVGKNKCAPPFRVAEFEIEFGKGIALAGEVLDRAVETGAVVKAGSWFSLADGTKLAQGREATKKCLEEQPELMQKLRSEVSKK